MNYLLPLICTLVGIAGVVFSLILASLVKSAPAGSEKMVEIANAIKTGAIAYLNRQLKSMGIAGIIVFIIIIIALGFKTALGFLVGAVASFAAGYIGMRVARDPDAFPDNDWVVLKMLDATPAAARAQADAWRPWRAYAVMYLWRMAQERRANNGRLTSAPASNRKSHRRVQGLVSAEGE